MFTPLGCKDYKIQSWRRVINSFARVRSIVKIKKNNHKKIKKDIIVIFSQKAQKNIPLKKYMFKKKPDV